MAMYRVLMEDSVNDEKFQFAILVEAENTIGSETLAQHGWTDEHARIWQARTTARVEFPEAIAISVENISEKIEDYPLPFDPFA